MDKKQISKERTLIYDIIEAEHIKTPKQFWERMESEPFCDESKKSIADDNWGFDFLTDKINNAPEISDIRLESPTHLCYVEKGIRKRIKMNLTHDEYNNTVNKILNNNKKLLTETNAIRIFSDPYSSSSCYLRYTACHSSINNNGYTSIFIRKTLKDKKDFDYLIKEKFATREQLEYLKTLWEAGESVLIIGPNGSGKTTLINALIDYTDKSRSAIVIQESLELFCKTHPEMIFRQMNTENTNSQSSLAEICRAALTESFDTFIIGEVKGPEAAQLGYAAYTGSQCMASTHGVSIVDGVERIVDYCLEAEPNRSRNHFLKQLTPLKTAVYIHNYQIEKISHIEIKDGKISETPVFWESEV